MGETSSLALADSTTSLVASVAAVLSTAAVLEAVVDLTAATTASMTTMGTTSVVLVLKESITQQRPCNSISMTALALIAATVRTMDLVDSKFIPRC